MMRALARLAPATHWTSLVIPLSAAALVVGATGATGAARTSIVVPFLTFCPGLVLIRAFRLSFAPLVDAGYAVTTSIAIAGIAAGVVVYAGDWNPNGIVAALGAISLTMAGLAAGRRARNVAFERRRRGVRAHAPLGRAKTWTPGAPALPELDGLRRTLEDLDELRAALEASRAEILTALERNERGIAFEKLRTACEAAGEHIKRTRATLKRTFRDSG
jgi:hypothetical protein